MKSPNLQILFFLCFASISQAQIAETPVGKMVSINEDKAYLSFDKPFYTTGETMYFKAFLANATTHVPDSAQTVLYVDVIEIVTKRTILQQKLKMQNGQASSSFLTEGVAGAVFVHAYTRWMSNLAADYHFNKSIQIFAPKDANALTITPKTDDKTPKKKIGARPDVAENTNDAVRNAGQQKDDNASSKSNLKKVKSLQFFPESGNILAKFANRVAFKATNELGKGIAIRGIIKNEKGDSVQEFSDTFLGMGRFNLVVEKAEKFTAEVRNYDGTTTAFSLPDVLLKGAVMVIEQKQDTADVSIVFYVNYDSLSMPNGFNLLVHQRGKICFYNPIIVKNKANLRMFRLKVPRTAFNEEGIATFSLFDEKNNPLAERLLFIRNAKRELNINLTTEKSVFDKRERVTVKIDATNNDGQPVAANLSFAVTNNDKIGTPQYAEDFRAYMLLRSDLRGHIEQPNYYFEDTTAKARLALDNLLMTQGWRRFDWKEKPDSLYFKHERGLGVEAVLYKRKKPAANAITVLLLKRDEDKTQSVFTQTDENGRFVVQNLDFIDSALLFVNVANSTKTYTVEQVTPKSTPSVSDPKTYFADQPAVNLNAYLEASQAVLLDKKLRTEREIMLQEVEIKARKIDPLIKDPRSSFMTADRSFVIDSNETGMLLSFLESRGIRSRTTEDGDILLLKGRGDLGGTSFGVVIDGLGQFDGRMLPNMFMQDIQRIEIIYNGNGGFMGVNTVMNTSTDGVTNSSTDGVVNIMTKASDPNYWKTHQNNYNNDIPTLLLKGYAKQRQFYTPDYAEKKDEHALADHRTTLYWSPAVQTDKNGKATVSFFTSDDTQNAKILVEGIDGTGKIGVGKGSFKVN